MFCFSCQFFLSLLSHCFCFYAGLRNLCWNGGCQSYAHQGDQGMSLALLPCCLREHSRIMLPFLSDQERMHMLPVTC